MLLGTSVINAMILYKQFTGKQIQTSEFRQEVINDLGKIDDQVIFSRSKKHKLVENNECKRNSNRKKRSRCVGCYERLRKELS